MMSGEKNAGSVSGLVFDIRRFSVHDGSGIRTTVFLKGCPLRCRWCQNPEGVEDFLKPVWLSGACIGCGKCYKAIAARDPKEAVTMLNTMPPQKANEVMDRCPAKALVWNGRLMSVDEVMAEVIKDKVFFTHGGGVTLSGGEPLVQEEFALALLAKMREAGIHTAIETSLYAKPDIVEKAAELSDGIFADCKIVDQKKHSEATGRGNETILANLDRLLTGKHTGKVIVRVPLIPGFTGDIENISAVADFVYARNPAVPLELLNYNPLAASKYPYGDLEGRELENCKVYSPDKIEKFKAVVRERGVKCIEWV